MQDFRELEFSKIIGPHILLAPTAYTVSDQSFEQFLRKYRRINAQEGIELIAITKANLDIITRNLPWTFADFLS